MLSHENISAIINYDPQTGIFVWKERLGVHKSWNTKYAGKIAGNPDAYGYLTLPFERKAYKAHRVAWMFITGFMPSSDIEVDHINGDRADNRACNLRLANNRQNAVNAKLRSDNKSGVKGVSKRNNRWVVQIADHGVKRHLGNYDDLEIAGLVYSEHAAAIYGEYVRCA